MPSTPMFKVVQVATGVAGAPYYVTGYFESLPGGAQAAADAWALFVRSPPASLRPGLRWEAINSVDTIDPLTGDVTDRTTVNVAQGLISVGSDPIPPANQLVVTWRTGVFVAGRELRGRTNLPGYTDGDNVDGIPGASLRNAVLLRATTLLATAGANHVVYSPKSGSWAQTNGAGTMTQWGVLRSRRD